MNPRTMILRFCCTGMILSLCGCGVMEMSGTMMRKTGEAMSDYGDKHDGFIGKMSGFGGKIHTAVGSTVEDMARREESETPETPSSKAESEIKPARQTKCEDGDNDLPLPTKTTVLNTQNRLKELGYPPGPIDGIMGSKTRAALGEFQTDNKLPVTQSLDRETLKALSIPNP